MIDPRIVSYTSVALFTNALTSLPILRSVKTFNAILVPARTYTTSAEMYHIAKMTYLDQRRDCRFPKYRISPHSFQPRSDLFRILPIINHFLFIRCWCKYVKRFHNLLQLAGIRLESRSRTIIEMSQVFPDFTRLDVWMSKVFRGEKRPDGSHCDWFFWRWGNGSQGCTRYRG